MESIGGTEAVEAGILKCRDEFGRLQEKAAKGTGRDSLDAVERELFADLLRLGREMIQTRVKAEEALDHGKKEAVDPRGEKLPYHSRKKVSYRSVFGEIEIERGYYWEKGSAEGFCPLDARLNLPSRKDSYLLQEWALRMGVAESYDEVQGGLSELLGLEIPKRQLEAVAGDAGASGRTFYDQKQAPPPRQGGPILVVEADGKGVPMKKDVPKEKVKRLSKGQKRDKKKMAWVGVVYTTEPRRGEEDDPKPVGKEVFAEIQKRDQFVQELFARAQAREGQVKKKAFLGDGQRDLWEFRKKYFPGYEEVLDWMHASEYLWKAAYLFLPESSPQACAWVERQQKRFRRGQVKDVIREIQRLVADETIHGADRPKRAQKIAGYFQTNQKRMRYDRYRRRGLPIGTGAVEGTCRYLVKDRMERSGMRWTVDGAQAILTLRGIYVSAHWDRYWPWYRASEAMKLYGKAATIKAVTSGMAA